MGFLSMKRVAISTGIVSMAMGLKLILPFMSHFLITKAAPSISTFFVTSLTPPYLYLLLNFIILTIFATSKLHHHHSSPESPLLATDPLIHDGTTLPDHVTLSQTETNYKGNGSETFAYEPNTPLTNETVTNGFIYEDNVPLKTTVAASEGTIGLQRKDSSDFVVFSDENTKPPSSARFSNRKAGRANSEGGKVAALGVAKPKRQDTLESTWRTITEGRAMPLTRHLKKSDTCESHARRSATPLTDLNDGGGGATPPPKMKKSETFSGRENSASPAGPGEKLRKESSLSQDELNRRVEAFINKFNAEMRLQRQESLRQYREIMTNRGAQ